MGKSKKFFSWVLVIVSVGIIFSGCTTIRQQEMINLGDETKTKNVVAKVEHFDWLGMGFTGETVAEEYNKAVDEAFKLSPPGTKKLLNVKAFKEDKLWPFYIGFAIMELGSLFTVVPLSDGDIETALPFIGLTLLFDIGGGLVMGIHAYDLYIVAEPSSE